MSSANLKSLSFSPFILIPCSYRFALLQVCSKSVVNKFGEMVSPCRTPHCIKNLLVSCSNSLTLAYTGVLVDSLCTDGLFECY